jgi:hypothetical protein
MLLLRRVPMLSQPLHVHDPRAVPRLLIVAIGILTSCRIRKVPVF